jgi:hypothetical protein
MGGSDSHFVRPFIHTPIVLPNAGLGAGVVRPQRLVVGDKLEVENLDLIL